MATYGKLREFQPDTERIEAYLDRVEVFYQANDIGEDKQVAVFLSVIGGKTFSLLRDLLAPDKPQDKTLPVLFETLKRHFEPKPLVIAERFHFHLRNQGPTESVAEYLAELRRLATHCEFGNYLNEALRDRLVCGLRNPSTQKRLLAEADLTLAKASATAQGMEAAEKNSKKFQGGEAAPVHRMAPQGTKPGPTSGSKPCYRCGGVDHTHSACRFRDATCHKCQKKGHIAKVCRSGRKQKQQRPQRSRSRPVRTIDQEPDSDEGFTLFKVGSEGLRPIVVTMGVNGQQLPMEVDTGAAVSVISSATQAKLFPKCQLDSSQAILTTYTGEQMPVVGQMKVEVSYQDQRALLTLFVLKGHGPSLLGRDWLRQIRLDWKGIGMAALSSKAEALVGRFPEVFEEGSGLMNTFQASLHLKPECRPKFHKARPVPFALKQGIDRELDRLEGDGIITKVSHSQWAAPVVPVPKGDGHIRLCGDYKVTINPVLEVDQYPLPKPDDMFATLAGGKKFTKIDLTHAYQQMSLEESSRELVTINTHRGLYMYTRLPFGVASAPAVFQKTMDTVLQGLPKVICYLDDILITGSSEQEHLENVEKVLQRLKEYNIRAKRAKCAFMEDSVEYLGHRIDATGLHTTSSKVEAITQAPRPRNVQELRSFLGLLHYYGKFLPSLATLLQPLNSLLKAGHKWAWTKECAQAFEAAKKLLASAPVLAHYDPSLPMKMAGDASAYGIGAVISHVFPDGQERPIAFASRTLTATERNYSQIEKEALSLVYGIRKFHQYLYGRRFVLVTDHKPLTTVLGPKNGIPPLAAARLQRWALLLSAYSYDIEFKPTRQHGNADGLSRLPLGHREAASLECHAMTAETAFAIGQIQALPVTVERVQTATRQDPVLSKVLLYAREGWPTELPEEYKPYLNRKDELSSEGDCLLWGTRVVVPSKLRARLVEELHHDHPGVTRMKAVARSYMWWPGLDKDLEECARGCRSCQSFKSAPPVAPLHPWLWPAKPWQRVHIDFAGPFMGKMFLIAVDAYSKWPEVVGMTSTEAPKTISELRKIFAANGLPQQLVTDNGPQFVSGEFATFMKMNGIKHIRCAPYHPSSNGAAERFVQTFKKAMKAGQGSAFPLSQRVSNFLLTYRTTPHATTNETPSQLLMGRKIRTRLDLLRPDGERHVSSKQAQQKADHDKHARSRELHTGQSVMARNLRPGVPWVPGVIVEQLGPLTYRVQVEGGLLWRRHLDHLRTCSDAPFSREPREPIVASDTDWSVPVLPERATNTDPSIERPSVEPLTTERRYPQRERRAPDRLI